MWHSPGPGANSPRAFTAPRRPRAVSFQLSCEHHAGGAPAGHILCGALEADVQGHSAGRAALRGGLRPWLAGPPCHPCVPTSSSAREHKLGTSPTPPRNTSFVGSGPSLSAPVTFTTSSEAASPSMVILGVRASAYGLLGRHDVVHITPYRP